MNEKPSAWQICKKLYQHLEFELILGQISMLYCQIYQSVNFLYFIRAKMENLSIMANLPQEEIIKLKQKLKIVLNDSSHSKSHSQVQEDTSTKRLYCHPHQNCADLSKKDAATKRMSHVEKLVLLSCSDKYNNSSKQNTPREDSKSYHLSQEQSQHINSDQIEFQIYQVYKRYQIDVLIESYENLRFILAQNIYQSLKNSKFSEHSKELNNHQAILDFKQQIVTFYEQRKSELKEQMGQHGDSVDEQLKEEEESIKFLLQQIYSLRKENKELSKKNKHLNRACKSGENQSYTSMSSSLSDIHQNALNLPAFIDDQISQLQNHLRNNNIFQSNPFHSVTSSQSKYSSSESSLQSYPQKTCFQNRKSISLAHHFHQLSISGSSQNQIDITNQFQHQKSILKNQITSKSYCLLNKEHLQFIINENIEKIVIDCKSVFQNMAHIAFKYIKKTKRKENMQEFKNICKKYQEYKCDGIETQIKLIQKSKEFTSFLREITQEIRELICDKM